MDSSSDQVSRAQHPVDLWILSMPDDPYAPCPCGCGMKWRFAVQDGIEKHEEKFLKDHGFQGLKGSSHKPRNWYRIAESTHTIQQETAGGETWVVETRKGLDSDGFIQWFVVLNGSKSGVHKPELYDDGSMDVDNSLPEGIKRKVFLALVDAQKRNKALMLASSNTLLKVAQPVPGVAQVSPVQVQKQPITPNTVTDMTSVMRWLGGRPNDFFNTVAQLVSTPDRQMSAASLLPAIQANLKNIVSQQNPMMMTLLQVMNVDPQRLSTAGLQIMGQHFARLAMTNPTSASGILLSLLGINAADFLAKAGINLSASGAVGAKAIMQTMTTPA